MKEVRNRLRNVEFVAGVYFMNGVRIGLKNTQSSACLIKEARIRLDLKTRSSAYSVKEARNRLKIVHSGREIRLKNGVDDGGVPCRRGTELWRRWGWLINGPL